MFSLSLLFALWKSCGWELVQGGCTYTIGNNIQQVWNAMGVRIAISYKYYKSGL